MTNAKTTTARLTIRSTACPECGARAGMPCKGDRSIQGTLDMHGQDVPTVFRDYHAGRYLAAKARRPVAF